MGAIPRLASNLMAEETLPPQPTLNFFQMWKGILDGTLNSYKIIVAQQRRIRYLEGAVVDSRRTISDLEQTIMEFGDSQDTPKTLRHKLLKIVDEKFHQKTNFLV